MNALYKSAEKPECQQTERQENLINAQRVQQGLLPKKRHFKRLFSDSFTLYEPQDMLSGDFYWVGTRHELRYLVVGDCTGHGISASLTSVLAINLIEYAIMNKGLKKITKILAEIDKRYTESFKGANSEQFDNPWIDLSIICIDDQLKKVFYSSANRKMLHISNNKKEIYKPKGAPIGGWQITENRSFETLAIDFSPKDRIYLGSDGFQDQFGGPKNKKYSSARLHEFLLQHNELPFEVQKEQLNDEFIRWKGENAQTDDVCIVGVEL